MAEVFISFKNTANGQTTVDAEHAKSLYETLSGHGIDCFFSNETLAEMGADDFLARIEEEVSQAQTMIVVCSNPDYIKDGWVRQEWSTFLNLMLGSDEKPRALFSYTIDCNPHTLPAFLQNYQSFTSVSEAVVFIENVLRSNDPSNIIDKPLEFWDNYFGLFCNKNVESALKAANSTVTFEEASLLLAHMNVVKGVQRAVNLSFLQERCSSGNAIAGFLLREVYLRGNLGYQSVRQAKHHCATCMEQYSPSDISDSGNVLLLVWNEKPKELTRALFCAELMKSILRDYSIESTVAFRVLDPNRSFDLRFDDYSHVVVLMSSRSCCLDDAFIECLSQAPRNETRLMLNGFLLHALPKELRKMNATDCSSEGLASVCRAIIVSCQAGQTEPPTLIANEG